MENKYSSNLGWLLNEGLGLLFANLIGMLLIFANLIQGEWSSEAKFIAIAMSFTSIVLGVYFISSDFDHDRRIVAFSLSALMFGGLSSIGVFLLH